MLFACLHMLPGIHGKIQVGQMALSSHQWHIRSFLGWYYWNSRSFQIYQIRKLCLKLSRPWKIPPFSVWEFCEMAFLTDLLNKLWMLGGRDFIKGMHNFDLDNMDFWKFSNSTASLPVNVPLHNLKRMVLAPMLWVVLVKNKPQLKHIDGRYQNAAFFIFYITSLNLFTPVTMVYAVFDHVKGIWENKTRHLYLLWRIFQRYSLIIFLEDTCNLLRAKLWIDSIYFWSCSEYYEAYVSFISWVWVPRMRATGSKTFSYIIFCFRLKFLL